MPSSWRANLSADPESFLVVALSGRALAAAARRAGCRARVLDLFGDMDTRVHADACLTVDGSPENGFEPAALLRAAERLAPAAEPARYGLVYGAGLESAPDLLARLTEGRRLYGNSPATVARTKDPRQFFALLDRLGVPHPTTTYTPPADPTGWLAKQVGAAGGAHIVPAGSTRVANSYYQRRAPGRPVGASFLADGRQAFLLGFSEQSAASGSNAESFRFGGVLQPAALADSVANRVPGMLDALVRELGLVGLNSLDMMVDGADLAILEINPRPGANLDIFDADASAALFGLHLAACRGRLPQRWTPPRRATAMSVVYAERPLRVPLDLEWPSWAADRPAPGATVSPGWPICSLLAAAPTPEAARQALATRTTCLLSKLDAVVGDAVAIDVVPVAPAAALHPNGAGRA
jgi:uncharacterized protein